MILTTTMFNDYQTCPQLYWHKYVDRRYRDKRNIANFKFGDSIELGVDAMALYPDRAKVGRKIFKYEWSRFRSMEMDYSGRWDWEALDLLGLGLMDYLEHNKPPFMNGDPLDIQRRVARPIPGTSLVAATYTDVFWWGPRKTAINIKTSQSAYFDAPGIAAMDWQLLFEAWCGGAEDVAFLILTKGKVGAQWITAPVSDYALGECERVLTSVGRRIEAGDFAALVQARSWGGVCNDCVYLGPCLAKRANRMATDGTSSDGEQEAWQALTAGRLAVVTPGTPDGVTGRYSTLWVAEGDIGAYPGWQVTKEEFEGLVKLRRPMYQRESEIG